MTTEIVSHVLDSIPFALDLPALLRRVHVKPESANAVALEQIARAGEKIARPKAVYQVAYINMRSDDFVEVEGVAFHSRVVAVNMHNAFRVFPHVITCGMELQTWAGGFEDMVERFWAESLKEMALFAARQAVHVHIEQTYAPGETATMNPGSLTDWPIQEQIPLFKLLAPHPQAIGVTLTDSLLMIPTKSVSGITFPTTTHFESCQLCPRDACPGRRAPYDSALYDQRYQPDLQ